MMPACPRPAIFQFVLLATWCVQLGGLHVGGEPSFYRFFAAEIPTECRVRVVAARMTAEAELPQPLNRLFAPGLKLLCVARHLHSGERHEGFVNLRVDLIA